MAVAGANADCWRTELCNVSVKVVEEPFDALLLCVGDVQAAESEPFCWWNEAQCQLLVRGYWRSRQAHRLPTMASQSRHQSFHCVT